jgi:integrase
VISPAGQFQYVTIVPETAGKQRSPWAVQLRQPQVYDGPCLLGHSPTLTITDADPVSNPSIQCPGVRRSRFTLTASAESGATIHSASFYLDRDLGSAFEPGERCTWHVPVAAASASRCFAERNSCSRWERLPRSPSMRVLGYLLDAQGVERRIRKQVVLCPAKVGESINRKRQAQKLLQPYLDRVNSSLSAPLRERKNATFAAFAEIWERDYLSLSKPSTQSSTRSNLKKLKDAFGTKDMRQIDAGDIQRLIVRLKSEGLDPKTIRNLWGTVSLIWQAALAQKYVDAVLPKPKLPTRLRKKARFFTLDEVGKIIAASEGEYKVFYWLAAETGLRAGELAGLRLTDISGEGLTVNQSVWHGKEQAPKTENAIRAIALSPRLVELVWKQIARQKAKGHTLLFSAATGSPWDMNVYRNRKMRKLLKSLGIQQAGFHALRHFNVSLLDSLRVPLKVIQERAGHALTGSLTLDVYGHGLDWKHNVEAAQEAGAAIAGAVEKAEKSAPFVSLTAINENGSQSLKLEAA